MGAVYKAEDLRLNRLVAVKVIRRELAADLQAMQRFKQELILAREVTHRNVVRLYDLGQADGIDFITMEFIDGEDLGTILKRQGKLAPTEAADIISQICSGLQAAHAQGIIHRDLKPGNIMRDRTGRIVVMDFGLARTLGSQSMTQSMTQSGALVGTMEYMSPEQAKGEHVDARSDLFTVGLIFYELLTGVRPYQSDSAVASLLKRTRERPQPPSSRDASIPTAISSICTKCLEVSPTDRYQSATDMLADLDAWKTGPAERGLARRRMAWLATAIASVVVAVAVMTGVFFLRLRPTVSVAHAPVSVLVADFTNNTGEAVFDDTLEPMFNVALEGASFLNAFSRGQARKLALKLPKPTDKLDAEAARLVAVSEGINVVVTGSLTRGDDGYRIAVQVLDARTGNSIANPETTVKTKDAVLPAIPRLVAPIRKVLGDSTPESAQLNAVSGAFTAASLEAVHMDAIGVEQQFAGKFEEALQSFSKAAELDPKFARAYSGMAAMAQNLGRPKDAEKYIKLAMEHVDRMTERERYRNRGLYYLSTGNWQKCVEEYSQLVSRYPVDRVGQNNLASCFTQLRNGPKAVEAARRAVEIVPKGVGQRLNLSFISSFSGDFAGGEREARAALQLNPSSAQGYLVLAEAQLGQGQLRQAMESYHALEKVSVLGASMAAAGLADLAVYEGRFGDAVRTYEQGAAADLAGKMPENAAAKFAALAHTQLLRGQNHAALAAAQKALANSQSAQLRFLAAQTFLEAGEVAKAQKLAAGLGSELTAEPQSYGKIIEGMSALKRADARQAIKALTEANNLLDTWIGRFELGRAYLQAGAFAEADAEFDRCINRRGEALELFMDNVPTYGYYPLVYYYQGRVREGLKSEGFAEFYRTYLSIRGQAGEDSLIPQIRKRLGQ
jgi:tetratricopeptide (TPR) repeat protein